MSHDLVVSTHLVDCSLYSSLESPNFKKYLHNFVRAHDWLARVLWTDNGSHTTQLVLSIHIESLYMAVYTVHKHILSSTATVRSPNSNSYIHMQQCNIVCLTRNTPVQNVCLVHGFSTVGMVLYEGEDLLWGDGKAFAPRLHQRDSVSLTECKVSVFVGQYHIGMYPWWTNAWKARRFALPVSARFSLCILRQ